MSSWFFTQYLMVHYKMRFFSSLFSLILFLGVIICFIGYMAVKIYKAPSELEQDTYIIVDKGDGLNEITRNLRDKKVIDYPVIVKFFAYYQGVHTKIKAGEYVLPAHISPQATLEKMVAGDTLKHKITFIEGKTVYDTVQEINASDVLTGTVTELPLEGSLLPETYIFERNTDRNDLISRIQEDQKKFLADAWEKRIANLPIASPQDALILASIVEKETGVARERKLIASVFINRLRTGMRLQSDPTIIYGITKGKSTLERPIYRTDILNEQGGYNTYVIDALPPTPICNPSKESILAVLNPAETDYLFFVADGTGGHAFSKTLEGHNDNVQKWRVLEKEQKQEHEVKTTKERKNN